MSISSHLFVFLSLIIGDACSLGGKSFHVAQKDMTGKNYAVLALCDDSVKGHPINVTLSLRNDVGESVETIQFRSSKEPIEIEDHSAHNITEVVLTADVAVVPYNIQKVSVRIRDNLYKLHLNQECDDDEEFITSRTQQTFWSRRIDCERKDVYCDDRHDEFMGCESVFVYHLSWKRGATGRV